MLLGKRIPLKIAPGVNPSSDSTALDTIYWTNSDKIRFQGGKLRKMLGWRRIFPSNNQQITGAARNIFSYRDQNNNPITLIGTSTRLYAYCPLRGEDYFYNITPLSTTTTVLANAFTTEYNASVVVNITTTVGSPTVILTMPQYFEDGDIITISGVTTNVNGIPAANFNGNFLVESINNTQIEFDVATNATSSGSVPVTMTWASSYLYVTYPANGLSEYDRVKFLLATAVDGITAATINKEHTISNIVDTNTFTISTGVVATSLVTAGGGSSTTIQIQIPAGSAVESDGLGFGANQFGFGIFGAPNPVSGATTLFPRIWSMDTFGTNVVLTPGDTPSNNPGVANLYEWANDVTVAPVLISGAPNAVKWVYVSSNCVCTLGSGGVLNQFWSSDAGDYSTWTPGATNLANTQVFQQANAFLSQSRSRNFDMLFTSSAVWTMEFVGLPNIWLPRKLFSTDGIIAPKARGIVEDAVFWMGQGDFYGFDGYTVSVLPNNTVKRYVFDNLNWEEYAKCFVHVDTEWSTVRFYYCAGQDPEPNNYVDYNYKEGHWTIGTNSRTASEEPVNINESPLLIQSASTDLLAIPNGISTYFFPLGANPLTTVNSANTLMITIDYGNVYLQPGDTIFISGATTTNGILASQINGVKTIYSVTTEEGFGSGIFGLGVFGNPSIGVAGVTVLTSGSATSSGTGGGSAVTVGTSILAINYTGNSLQVGQPITISQSNAVDGFSAATINGTTTIRFIQGGVLEVNAPVTGVYSTSTVINGGGLLATITVMTDGKLFEHNSGLNDYNYSYDFATDPDSQDQYAPMNSYIVSNYAQIQEGDNTQLISALYPDIIQEQIMTVQVNVKEYAQSAIVQSQNFNMSPTMTKISPMKIGRVRQYQFTSNVIDGNFLLGQLFEEIQSSTPR